MPSPRLALLACGPIALALAACASNQATTDAITVDSSDTACTPSTLSVPAGQVTFAVTNTGTQVTELYIYRPDDTILAEVEDITPGMTRNLNAKLDAGTVELACKPGEKDPGFRQTLTVTG